MEPNQWDSEQARWGQKYIQNLPQNFFLLKYRLIGLPTTMKLVERQA